ncbi:hypothetical protein L210DRAFT_1015310 [Boletus edulis BED1]|uniref:Uncharacterized protein n=1 Tax=Boletus edulis BED1 TaxID=1328754 RepID=A0AAD4BV18_BOLED|nr:hypothetical protein L210DRAFT_1015310 [Boletus edulis BED1]
MSLEFEEKKPKKKKKRTGIATALGWLRFCAGLPRNILQADTPTGIAGVLVIYQMPSQVSEISAVHTLWSDGLYHIHGDGWHPPIQTLGDDPPTYDTISVGSTNRVQNQRAITRKPTCIDELGTRTRHLPHNVSVEHARVSDVAGSKIFLPIVESLSERRWQSVVE